MALYNRTTTENGFLLIDVLVGLFIASILTTAFLGSIVGAVRYANIQAKAVQAELLVIEMLEVARELESGDWAEVTNVQCVYPGRCRPVEDLVDGTWNLDFGQESIDSFLRSLTVMPVTRNASTHELDGSGVDDPNSKKIVATVEWTTYGTPRELSLETYVYYY